MIHTTYLAQWPQPCMVQYDTCMSLHFYFSTLPFELKKCFCLCYSLRGWTVLWTVLRLYPGRLSRWSLEAPAILASVSNSSVKTDREVCVLERFGWERVEAKLWKVSSLPPSSRPGVFYRWEFNNHISIFYCISHCISLFSHVCSTACFSVYPQVYTCMCESCLHLGHGDVDNLRGPASFDRWSWTSPGWIQVAFSTGPGIGAIKTGMFFLSSQYYRYSGIWGTGGQSSKHQSPILLQQPE